MNTAAFWAGKITAMMYNIYYTRTDLPHVEICMREFLHLKVILGKYYNLLKNNKNHNNTFLQYENIINKYNLSEEERGNHQDFMIGFGKNRKKN